MRQLRARLACDRKAQCDYVEESTIRRSKALVRLPTFREMRRVVDVAPCHRTAYSLSVGRVSWNRKRKACCDGDVRDRTYSQDDAGYVAVPFFRHCTHLW